MCFYLELFNMSKSIEVITLMSSDEETIPEIDTIETKNGKTTVKIEISENLKSDNKQLTSSYKNSSLSSSDSNHCLSAGSNLNLSLNKDSLSYNSNLVNKKSSNVNFNQTARKSFSLSTPQNVLKAIPHKEMHSEKQASCVRVKSQNKHRNHKINFSDIPQSCPTEKKDEEIDIDSDNVISCINKLIKRGLISAEMQTNNFKGTSSQDESLHLNTNSSMLTSNKNAYFNQDINKSKGICEKIYTESSTCFKKRKKENSINETNLTNNLKKRKLSKDSKEMNSFNGENKTSVTSTITKSVILESPVLLDEVADGSKHNLPKFDSCEKLSLSCLNTYTSDKIADLDAESIQSESNSSKNELSFDSKISDLVIPISSDGIVQLDTGNIQNECLQVKSLILDDGNSNLNLKTSNDIDNFKASSAQVSFSNTITSNNNLISEHVCNDMPAELVDSNEINLTMVTKEPPKMEINFDIKNLKCENTTDLKEENTHVNSSQLAQLLSSCSKAEKLTEEQKKPVKEVTSPKLSLKRKRVEIPNGVVESASLCDTKKSLFEIKNSKTEESLNKTNVSIHSLETHQVSQTSPPNEANDLLPGPSNRTDFTESNKQKFNLLIEFCKSQEKFNTEEGKKLQQIMTKKLEGLVESYIISLEFSNRIDAVYEKVKNDPSLVCDLLYDFKRELKAYKKPQQSIERETTPSLQQHNIDAPVQSLENSERNSGNRRTDTLNNQEMESEHLEINSVISNERTQTKSMAKRITELEKYLKDLDKKIHELESKELTENDMDDEDSVYILEDKYKRRFIKTWKYLCRLKEQSSDAGSEVERKFRYRGSRFPEINKEIEKSINKQKVEKRFPSYEEIYNIIKRVNERKGLGLRESDYDGEAIVLFKDIGQKLKRRRLNDLKHNLRCFESDKDDPAEKDEDLRRILDKNAKEGVKKLNDIIEKYTLEQENKKESVEDENKSTEDCSEDEESDASIETEYRVDSNLPDTEPTSPVSEPHSPSKDSRTNVAIVDIGSDSNASTDPGFKSLSSKEQFFNEHSPTSFHFESKTQIESDSSSDLPSL